MLIYGVDFEEGKIFQKKDNYELVFSSEDIIFGKIFRAKFKGSGTVEAFKINIPDAEYFDSLCIAGNGLLVGFLSRSGADIKIDKKGDEFTGYIEISQNTEHFIDLDAFVVLHGYDKYLLFKEYTKLVSLENKIEGVTKPYSALMVQNGEVNEIIKEAKQKDLQVLLLKNLDNAGSFVQMCKNNGLLAGAVVEPGDSNLIKLRETGFEFFQINFKQDRREDVQLIRKILKDSIFVAKGISLLNAAGLVDGLIVEKNKTLKDLARMSFMQKIVRLYLEMNNSNREMLDLCQIFNFGVIFHENSKKVEYADMYRLEKIGDHGFEVSYLDKNRILKRLLVSGKKIQTEIESFAHLKKELKIRSDGRSFYFYREG